MTTPAASPEDRRRGACPSLSAPMQTGDGLLVRLQPASGALTPLQLRGLAELAGQHGNGILEVTARGNLQIRGLTEASAARLAEGVAALAIEPRRGVPVEANPLAGLDPEEIADAAPLAAAIRHAISAAGLDARLGPKVTVVVDGGGQIGLGDLLADVRVAAARRAEGVAWEISLAGTAASARAVGVHTATDVPRVVTGLLAAIAEGGVGARGRDLLTRRNPAGSVANAAEPGSDAFTVGTIALRDGSQALAMGLAFGQIGAQELARFASLVEEAGTGAIRLAPQRRLILLGVLPSSLGRLEEAACEAGMTTCADDPRLRIAACAGAPGCRSAFLDTKALAARLAASVGEAGLHVSGCPKRCAEPAGTRPAAIGISEDEAEVAVGGSTKRVPIGKAADAASKLSAAVEKVFAEWRRSPPSALPGISPSRGEIGQSPRPKLPISPLEGTVHLCCFQHLRLCR